jgi:hypothetical protein
MKTFFACLVAFLFAFVIGCQESSITDPVSNDTELNLGTAEPNNFIDKDLISYYPGVIKLEGMLYDPSHYFNSFAEIKGIVRYRLDQINTDKRPPRPAIKVQLYLNAAIRGGHTGHNRPWTVNKTAEDIVYMSPATQSVYFLEKSFRVSNTCCAPLNLVLKFQVDEKVVTLVSMELKKVPGLLPIPDPEM